MTPRITDIQEAVSDHFGVSVLELRSHRRAVKVTRPRQVAMHLAKRLTSHSLPAIGRMFGNRDHSTVIHAVRRIDELCEQQPEMRDAVRQIKVSLNNRLDVRAEATLAYWGA